MSTPAGRTGEQNNDQDDAGVGGKDELKPSEGMWVFLLPLYMAVVMQ